MNDSPIFIHSLFRAGSTYLFNVFRRSTAGYWCYQEALHELVGLARNEPERLVSNLGEEAMSMYRHPQMDKPYFQELYETWPAWKDAFSEPAVFDGYFSPAGANIGIPYWRALSDVARGRPVFQECRTSGRIAAMKQQLGGFHIYLWRNPWDQWWSYKVTPYFDVTNQLIIHASHAPQPVQRLLATHDLPAYEHEDLSGASAFYGERPLTSEQSYQVFYLLWCLALREGLEHADLMLNIDRLSDSVEYQSQMQVRLQDAGIDGIDFSDCRIPQGRYLEKDQAFFGALEEQVHHWLLDGGWNQQGISQIQVLRQQHQPASWDIPIAKLAPSDLAEQASRARELAKRFETTLAERARNDTAKLSEIETKVHQAEIEKRVAVGEVKVQLAEAKVQLAEAEKRAVVAEAKTEQAEAKTEQAEAKAEQAEAKAEQTEAKAEQAEARAEQAEAKAEQAEARAEQAEAESNQALTQLSAVYASTSWRITAPLRVVMRLVMRLSPQRFKPWARLLLQHAALYIKRRPGLKRIVLRVLDHFPRIRARLYNVVRPMTQPLQMPQYQPQDSATEHLTLTPRARHIHADLKAAIERRQKGNG